MILFWNLGLFQFTPALQLNVFMEIDRARGFTSSISRTLAKDSEIDRARGFTSSISRTLAKDSEIDQARDFTVEM